MDNKIWNILLILLLVFQVEYTEDLNTPDQTYRDFKKIIY